MTHFSMIYPHFLINNPQFPKIFSQAVQATLRLTSRSQNLKTTNKLESIKRITSNNFKAELNKLKLK